MSKTGLVRLKITYEDRYGNRHETTRIGTHENCLKEFWATQTTSDIGDHCRPVVNIINTEIVDKDFYIG